MELFQEDEGCLRSSCTVTGGSYDLTAQLRAHVSCGKDAGDTGPHFCIRHDEALGITFQRGGQIRRCRFETDIDEQPFDRDLADLVRLQIPDAQAGQGLFAVERTSSTLSGMASSLS